MSSHRPPFEVEASLIPKFRAISLFAHVGDELIAAAITRSTLRHVEKGKEFLSFRDRTNDVFFVFEGRIQIKNFSSGGREFIYSEVGKGDLFGEFSALDNLPRSASVVAIEQSTVARMKAADFLDLLRSDFDLTLQLFRLLTVKARELSDRVLELIASSARQRLRFEISRLAAKGIREGGQIVIRPAPTHYELAARVGSQREVVTRELKRLVSLGHLHVNRQQIVVLDIERFSDELIALETKL
jgi:CRP/FNR family transcriptional regulator, cyclic AMP receptor protein